MKINYFKKLFGMLIISAAALSVTSCEKCQTCSHYQGGVAGGSITEAKEVCDESEADALEASSSINDSWTCE
jgi:hypothetical protein